MRIILKQDVDNLGLEGDIVEVAKGYARNYLIPGDIAVEASPQNVKAFEQHRKKIEVKRLRAKEEAEKLKQALEEIVVSFTQKAGEEGKLYGSVTSMDIASQLETKGVVIDRKKILLEKPIKTLGEFEVPIKIYPEVTGLVKVTVGPQEEKSE